MSSLGVYSGKLGARTRLSTPDWVISGSYDAVPWRKGAHASSHVAGPHGRVDLTPLVTHAFTLEQLPEAFELFSHQADGVMKVAIYPPPSR